MIGYVGAILSTDLSAAFDTDTDSDQETPTLQIHWKRTGMKSFLKEHMAYVQIDASKSKIIEFGYNAVI